MTQARRNHGLWLGPLLALAGLASYFTIVSRWRELSDTPWLNLAVLAAALGLSLAALPKAWSGGGLLRRAAALGGLVISGLCATTLVYYCFFLSYGVPDPARALPEGRPVPELTLLDDRGRSVELAELGRGDTVLVFFRGHW